MQSWNEKCRDSAYIEILRSHSPGAFLPDSYLLSAAFLREETVCAAGKNCETSVNAGEEETVDQMKKVRRTVSYSWVFCFACNSIYHLGCEGYRSQAFKGIKLLEPFRCKACLTNPNNELAREFFGIRDNIDLRIASRREAFLKAIDLSTRNVDEESSNGDSGEKKDEYHEEEMERLKLRCEHAERAQSETIKEIRKLREELERLKADCRINVDTSTINQRSIRSTNIPSREFIDVDLYSDPPIIRDFHRNRRSEGMVPLPEPHKLVIEDVDIDIKDLKLTERIELKQAQIKRENIGDEYGAKNTENESGSGTNGEASATGSTKDQRMAKEILVQAPKLSEMQHDQVSCLTRQLGCTVVVNTAIGFGSTAPCVESLRKSLDLENLGNVLGPGLMIEVNKSLRMSENENELMAVIENSCMKIELGLYDLQVRRVIWHERNKEGKAHPVYEPIIRSIVVLRIMAHKIIICQTIRGRQKGKRKRLHNLSFDDYTL